MKIKLRNIFCLYLFSILIAINLTSVNNTNSIKLDNQASKFRGVFEEINKAKNIKETSQYQNNITISENNPVDLNLTNEIIFLIKNKVLNLTKNNGNDNNLEYLLGENMLTLFNNSINSRNNTFNFNYFVTPNEIRSYEKPAEYNSDNITKIKNKARPYNFNNEFQHLLNLNIERIDENTLNNINPNEKEIFLNNTFIKLFNFPNEIQTVKMNKMDIFKKFQASFYEPYSHLKNRQIIKYNLEGSIKAILSEQDIYKLLKINKTNQENIKVYESKTVYLIRNPLLANKLKDLNALNFFKISYNCILIGVDLNDESYTIADFMAENLQSLRKPYFFIDSNSLYEILSIIEQSQQDKLDAIVAVEYNNSNEFFPQNYLYTLNYSLIIIMIIFAIIWIIMSWIYRRFYNLLHKLFSALLILKIFFCVIIISNLDIFLKKSTNQDDEEFIDDFLRLLFETILVCLNCIFKSLFFFSFFLIFDVRII